jgi:LacI family transcriptional regulator
MAYFYRNMKNVSIKDIAKEVGVSTTTVSFVLNGKAREKRISEDLKERIMETAGRMNYRPNQVARGLRTGQSFTLGLIVEDISNPFFAQLARHVEDHADKSGYTVMFCSTENDETKAANLLYMLQHRQMDGFIIIPTPGMRDELASFVDAGKPLVLVDRFFPDLDACHVAVDNYKGAYEAVELLVKKGRSRIGLVTIDSSQVQMREREQGYRAALSSHGIGFVPERVLRIPYDRAEKSFSDLLTDMLDSQPDLDAFFFTTNYLGAQGLDVVKKAGRRIPEDMAIVCFDDSILFRLGSPSVSVVAQPISELGQVAVRLIIDMISGRPIGDRKVVLSPDIIEREST